MNQCDGCMLGLPLDGRNHIHPNKTGWGRIHMACTKNRYEKPIHPCTDTTYCTALLERMVWGGPRETAPPGARRPIDDAVHNGLFNIHLIDLNTGADIDYGVNLITSTHPRTLINFCPFCGTNLQRWKKYQTADEVSSQRS